MFVAKFGARLRLAPVLFAVTVVTGGLLAAATHAEPWVAVPGT